MVTGDWLSQNWFDFLTSMCSIGGVWFAGFAIHRDAKVRREEAKERKIANQIAITANYLEIWKIYFHAPEVHRVLEPSADVTSEPVTRQEKLFVNTVISQMSMVYYSTKDDLLRTQEGARRDIAQFFSLPIPKAVWTTTKLLQNQDFAAFIDSALE